MGKHCETFTREKVKNLKDIEVGVLFAPEIHFRLNGRFRHEGEYYSGAYTAMRRDAGELGIVYSPDTPYEVLRTREMSVDDLRHARLLSRLIDGFYNAGVWQRVTRRLILCDVGFLPAFLAWMEERELLEQPLSLEKRGLLLYEFCGERYPAFLDEISVAWVLAGIPLAKEPGGRVRPWKDALPADAETLEGKCAEAMRLYHFAGSGADYWFGFDRAKSASRPLFAAWKRRMAE